MTSKIKLSILDQSPVRKGLTAADALRETTNLAVLAEELGYTRFWVSEHHNSSSFAGSSPDVFIAHLANHTKSIRVGSGGIMLPNHSALKMAESFRLLEALFPNRIDMGIGRAPGTDRLTASRLNPSNNFNPNDFIEQLVELDKYLHNARDKGSVFERVMATPLIETVPQRWMLTSSGESALFAAELGLPISFAHFINPIGVSAYSAEYKERFKPSTDYPQPMANVAVFAFCSESEEKVMRQKALMDHWFVQLERAAGNLTPVVYEDVKDAKYSSYEQQRLQFNRLRTIFGTPSEVKPRIEALAKEYGVDEVMLVTYSEFEEDKKTSYRLFADMFL